jgi:Kef-type K+ transport system membrane component KefB
VVSSPSGFSQEPVKKHFLTSILVMFLYVSATFYLLQVGFRACCVAVLGTILPLVAGTLLTMAYQKPFFPMGVAAGTALAPTSVGIALRLLGEAGVLKEDFGQVGAGCSGVEKIGDH